MLGMATTLVCSSRQAAALTTGVLIGAGIVLYQMTSLVLAPASNHQIRFHFVQVVTKLRLPLGLPPASPTMLGTRFHICAQRQGPLSDLWPRLGGGWCRSQSRW